jgi:hypothetical protein
MHGHTVCRTALWTVILSRASKSKSVCSHQQITSHICPSFVLARAPPYMPRLATTVLIGKPGVAVGGGMPGVELYMRMVFWVCACVHTHVLERQYNISVRVCVCVCVCVRVCVHAVSPCKLLNIVLSVSQSSLIPFNDTRERLCVCVCACVRALVRESVCVCVCLCVTMCVWYSLFLPTSSLSDMGSIDQELKLAKTIYLYIREHRYFWREIQ